MLLDAVIVCNTEWIKLYERAKIYNATEIARRLNRPKDLRLLTFLENKERIAREDFNSTIDWWCIEIIKSNKEDHEMVNWRLEHIKHPSIHIKRTDPMQRRYGMRYLEMWEFHAICQQWAIPSADELITRWGIKGEEMMSLKHKEEKALLAFNKRYCPVKDPKQIYSRAQINDPIPLPSQFDASKNGRRRIEIPKTEYEKQQYRNKNPSK